MQEAVDDGGASDSAKVKAIAFYLPQFHPIPENDAAWGAGFTEWRHVSEAKPLFPGHWQPRLPADLGFYDLRVPEVREQQVSLAKEAGISAFCYYHYWFAGHQVLERPFNEVLASGRPDFPFCLCWANESWTGIWHGRPADIILEQTYPGAEDHLAHFDILARAFADRRYLRINGKPVFLIFRPLNIPDLAATLSLWREAALRYGFPGLHLVAVRTYTHPWNPADYGFDASVTFRHPLIPAEYDRSIVRNVPWVIQHEQILEYLVEPRQPGLFDYPCTGPGWDNTPRCGNRGIVFHDSTPEHFAQALEVAATNARQLPPGQRLCFIKAWNEWGEGNYLEPDQRFGHGWLTAVRQVLDRVNGVIARE